MTEVEVPEDMCHIDEHGICQEITVDGINSVNRDDFGGYFYNFRDNECPYEERRGDNICRCNVISGGYKFSHDGSEMCMDCYMAPGGRSWIHHSVDFHARMTKKFGDGWWNRSDWIRSMEFIQGRYT